MPMETFFLFWADHPFVVTSAIVFVGYVLSLKLHPYVKCEKCDGKGLHHGAVFSYAHRKCHKCSGMGRKQRLGARFVGVGDRRASTSRFHSRNRF